MFGSSRARAPQLLRQPTIALELPIAHGVSSSNVPAVDTPSAGRSEYSARSCSAHSLLVHSMVGGTYQLRPGAVTQACRKDTTSFQPFSHLFLDSVRETGYSIEIQIRDVDIL